MLRDDNTWKPKRVSFDSSGQLTFASTKKRNKVKRLDIRSAGMEVVMTDTEFRDRFRSKFSFVEHSFVIRSKSSGAAAPAAVHFASSSLDDMAAWIVVLNAVLKAKAKPA